MEYSYSDYNGTPLLAVIIVLLIFTFFSVLLRCYVRINITRGFELDDFLMVISQICFLISCVFLLVALHYGLGHHNSTLTPDNRVEATKWMDLSTFSYITNMTFIKLSVAVFLLRLAQKPIYIWIVRLSIITVVVWSTAILLFDIFQCIPVVAQWDTELQKTARCINSAMFTAAAYGFSVMTICTDWLYALLPIPMIWSVRMTPKAKVTVAVILSLGIFASLATLIRLRYILELSDPDDNLFNAVEGLIWTLVEPGVAIIAASLITIRPLLRSLHYTGFDSSEPTNTQPLSLRADIAPNMGSQVDVESQKGVWDKDRDVKRSRGRSFPGYGGGKDRESGSVNVSGRRSGGFDFERGSEEYILSDCNGERERGRTRGMSGVGVVKTVEIRVENTRSGRDQDVEMVEVERYRKS